MNQKSDYSLKQCQHCNHTIEDPEALFCAQCGRSLCREGHCCSCGKHLQPKANFCDRCGATVVNPAQKSTNRLYAVVPSSATQEIALPEDNQIKEIIEEQVKRRVAEAQIERTLQRNLQKEKALEAKLLKYGLRESDWVSITGGNYMMGSPTSETGRFENEQQHAVEVSCFDMLKTPITFTMFDIFCNEVGHTRTANLFSPCRPSRTE